MLFIIIIIFYANFEISIWRCIYFAPYTLIPGVYIPFIIHKPTTCHEWFIVQLEDLRTYYEKNSIFITYGLAKYMINHPWWNLRVNIEINQSTAFHKEIINPKIFPKKINIWYIKSFSPPHRGLLPSFDSWYQNGYTIMNLLLRKDKMNKN